MEYDTGDRELARSQICAGEETMAAYLRAIWSKVLGRTDVGLEDDFYNLGGDSIQLMQVGARVKDETNIAIPFKILLEHRTLLGLSRQVRQLLLSEALQHAAPEGPLVEGVL
jgi:acyl carrier protein